MEVENVKMPHWSYFYTRLPPPVAWTDGAFAAFLDDTFHFCLLLCFYASFACRVLWAQKSLLVRLLEHTAAPFFACPEILIKLYTSKHNWVVFHSRACAGEISQKRHPPPDRLLIYYLHLQKR